MYPLENWTENFNKAFTIAGSIAAETGTNFIGSEHLIYAFLSLPESEACKILAGEGVSKEEYGALFTHSVDTNYAREGLTPRTRLMYDLAVKQAEKDGLTPGTVHMLYQILCVECEGVRFLRRFADVESLKRRTVVALRVLKNKKMWGETESSSGSSSSFLTNDYEATQNEAPPRHGSLIPETLPIRRNARLSSL